MHPDEATEPIVDAALADGKPFAILPCCVAPLCVSLTRPLPPPLQQANPHRRTAVGLPVISYEQYLDYLQAKHPAIRRARLAKFEGRNVVLWYDPLVPYCEPCEE